MLLIVTSLFLVACSAPETTDPVDTNEPTWTDGTYTGSAQGYKSEIEVEVVVAGGKITEVNVLNHDETPGISNGAIVDTPKAIIEAQTAEIDALSGATGTSRGIIEAAQEALANAK